MDIHVSSLNEFVMPKVKSVVVTDYYEGILGLISSRDEFPYNEFFANPKSRTQTTIVWSTDAFTKKPTQLCYLQGTQKEQYSVMLKERIVLIEQLIETLRAEGVVAELIDLLNKAIAYIDEESVYCGEDKVVIVNWGMIPRSSSLGIGNIYQSGRFSGKWKDIAQMEPHVTDVVLPTTGHDVVEADKSRLLLDDAMPNLVGLQEQKHELVKEDKPADIDASARDLDEGKMAETQIEDTRKDEAKEKLIEEQVVDTKEKGTSTHQDEPMDADKNKNSFLFGIYSALTSASGVLMWIIMLLLLLFLLLFLLRHNQGPICRVNPFFDPLPKMSRVLPVDSKCVGMSEDGYSKIATDRLNVLLYSDNVDAILEWATAFKKAYYTADYEIFYYNKELNQLQIRIPAARHEQVKREIYDKIPNLKFEVFDETVSASETVHFNDPALTNDDYSWYLKTIGVYDAWDITRGDSDIIVAVVDNGFDLSHPELQGKVIYPYNVLTQNDSVLPILTKNGISEHGTHVAATAVGNANNRLGLLGIAPECKLMPIQVGANEWDGFMSNQAIIEGVLYAINHGADVINMSLGWSAPKSFAALSEAQQLNYILNNYKAEEMVWRRVEDKARSTNCIIVQSAGNENVISGFDPRKRTKGSILVSAVDRKLKKADFSNYGRYLDIDKEYSSVSAPGVDIYNAIPGKQYASLYGTSMASPIVAGAVALLKSRNKNITVDQVRQLLQQTGTEINPKVGPLINLSKIFDQQQHEKSCDEIVAEVARLRAKIDSLCQICPDAALPNDTLRYDDAIRGGRSMDGQWMSSTPIVASSDNSPITVYMEFSGNKGLISLHNHNHIYTAPLTLEMRDKHLYITQLSDAVCPTDKKQFLKYSYTCSSDRKGYLVCKGENEHNSFKFNLIRVK